MKWILGAFSHETNNFSVVPTDLDAFRAQAFKTGDEIIEWARAKKTPIGGFIARIAEGKISPVYAVEQPLILPPCSTCNTISGLYPSLWKEALRQDRPAGILSTSLFAGFPHADHPDAGFTASDLSRFPYQRIRRPMFPID